MAELELIGPTVTATLTDLTRQRTRDLIARCAGIEEAGLPEFARETSWAAHELLDALDALDGERSARVALQATCERQQKILGKALYQACDP